MIGIRFSSKAHAEAVSRGLWLLSRPETIGAGETTQKLATVEPQKDGTALLILDPTWTLPVHPGVVAQITDAADTLGSRARLAELLGPLLASRASGLTATRALIAKGGALRLADLLPLLNPALVSAYVPPVRVGP